MSVNVPSGVMTDLLDRIASTPTLRAAFGRREARGGGRWDGFTAEDAEGRRGRLVGIVPAVPAVDEQATSGHNEAMKQTTVSGLKARLSTYLAEVRNGETVIVCDRKTPIARLVPLTEAADDFHVDEPETTVARLKGLPTVRLRRKVDVVALLRADRDQR